MLRIVAVILAAAALLAAPGLAQSPESSAWVRAQQSCDGLRAYIRDYPNGRFIARARAELPTRCPAPTPPQKSNPPTSAQKSNVPRVVEKSAPLTDRCIQARADWANIQGTSDLAVLRAFRDSAPASCAVQRAQAQSRIEAVEAERARAAAEERARAEALQKLRAEETRIKAQFEGAWVQQSGSGNCNNLPYRFEAHPEGVKVTLANGSADLFRVASTNPPRLELARNLAGGSGFVSDLRFTLQDDGTILVSWSSYACTLRRQ